MARLVDLLTAIEQKQSLRTWGPYLRELSFNEETQCYHRSLYLTEGKFAPPVDYTFEEIKQVATDFDAFASTHQHDQALVKEASFDADCDEWEIVEE